MRDLVIIPTFARPEYLHLCMEHLEAARGDRNLEYWLFFDKHGRDTALQTRDNELAIKVAAEWKASTGRLHYWIREPHNFVGNVLNHMEAYKQAYQETQKGDVRYIYHVEDDVFVSPDFFRWHEAIQEKGDYFVSVGWHCIRNAKVHPSLDPTAYIESAVDLSSIGLCWKPKNLTEIVGHAKLEYYRDHGNYMGRNFPHNPIPVGQWTEQAGLVFRVMLSKLNIAVWPALRRCAHVGVSGYHRPGGYRFEGELEQRIDMLRQASSSTRHIVSLCRDPFDDIQSPVVAGPWEPQDLHCVQTFIPADRLPPRSLRI